MAAIRILIADDHPVVRQGLRWLIETEPDLEVVGEAGDGGQAAEEARRLRPDVVLLDLVMPVHDGLWAIKEIAREAPSTRVLVLTSFAEDSQIITAIQSGALGYLLKDSPSHDLLAAVREVAAGGSPMPPAIARKLIRQMAARPAERTNEDTLSQRELDVLAQVAHGLSNQEIADVLVVSERTVRCHVSNILHKLNLASRTQAALYALQHGLAEAAPEPLRRAQ
ncbi:MAG: response regulator [Chloroflexota bacterium]